MAQSLFSAIVALSCWSACIAQNIEQLWTTMHGGTQWDEYFAVTESMDGNYISAGITKSYCDLDGDFWLVKSSSDGDTVWSHCYGGTELDACQAIVCMPENNGCLLGGYTQSFGCGWGSLWLLMTNCAGDSVWSRSFGGYCWSGCNALCYADDGTFVAAGIAWIGENADILLLKIASNGDSVWCHTLGSQRLDNCLAVRQTADGGFALLGYSDISGFGDLDVLLMKANSQGIMEWSRTYGGGGEEIGHGFLELSDGGFVICGYTVLPGGDDRDFLLIKTDEFGNPVWQRVFGTSAVEECYSVFRARENEYLLLGSASTHGISGFFEWVIRTDAMGDSLWSCAIPCGNQVFTAAEQVADKDYALCGYTSQPSAEYADACMMKIRERSSGIAISSVTHECRLGSYPNPFNATAILTFRIPVPGSVSIRVFDVLGRDVGTIADNFFSAGTYRQPWNPADLCSGTYWIRIHGNGFDDTHRITLIR